MWNEGYHCKYKDRKSSYDLLKEVKGKLEPDEARKWFAKFCKSNLSFIVNLLIGVKIAPIQEIKLRSFFLRDFALDIEGRGNGKSFIVSIFIILYAIFRPGCKIGIASGTFRQSKLIFRQIEKFIDAPQGKFLKQCVGKKRLHNSDGYELTIGRSTIMAVPLTEKIRGLRFNVIIIDELMLVPSETISTVILPFLSVKQDGLANEELYAAETKLIEAGQIQESERTIFPKNKIIGMSSASFKFEALYKENYAPNVQRISNPSEEGVNHVVMKLSYETAPEGLLDLDAIRENQSKMSRAAFDREYRAIFTDDGSGYFSIESLMNATVPVGEYPMVRAIGDNNKKYILSIDANYSQSEIADNFAMAILELDEENKSGTLVHAYAVPNAPINKKVAYFNYLLKNFNVVYIIADVMGGSSFIIDAQELLGSGIRKLELFEDTFFDGEEGLRLARQAYNNTTGKIVHYQGFGKNNWLRYANEALQGFLENKRIRFASQIIMEADRNRLLNQDIPIKDLQFSVDSEKAPNLEEKMEDFIDNLNFVINMTRTELTLIEVDTSESGHQTFKLPSNIRSKSDPSRARRDSYTALLLAAWGMKCYFELQKAPQTTRRVFLPSWIA